MATKSNPLPKAKVLIVDDHPAVREALVIRISTLPDMEVCGEAADAQEAMDIVAEKKPTVAIIDITLRNGSGIDLIKRIQARDQDVRLLVWSMHAETLYAERALRAGAMGYITKEQATSQMIDAIRQVIAGKIYLSPRMTDELLTRTVGGGKSPLDRSPVEALSDRELEVFRLIGQGITTAEIATRLHLSIGTIWTYRDRIREKLNLRGGTKLTHFATEWVVDNP
jgi:DNA-binding NarL/FixJ family response regulator